MSRLMGEMFRESPLLLWPLVSLSIFVMTFIGVFVMTMRRSNADIAAASAIPLAEDVGGPGDE